MRLFGAARICWEKNWPEVHAALKHGIAGFVFSAVPAEILEGVPVFCYHAVQPAELERDLAFLKRNEYSTLSADQLLDHLTGASPAPERSVVLTFDDGHVSLYDVVFPLLRRFGQTGVAFVAPRFHDALDEDPWAQLEGTGRPCTWREIEEMHESGCIDVQSHTFEHRYLPRWPEPAPLVGVPVEVAERMRRPPASIADDLSAARATLEYRLAKNVVHLAFPRYVGTEEATTAAVACGYRGLWLGTVPHRPLNRAGESPLHIARMSGEFVRRLPGDGRAPLLEIFGERYARNVRRWLA